MPSRERVPDFFIVGHHKCGTTALYEMLRAPPADLHARCQGAVVLPAGEPRVLLQKSSQLPKTLEEYLALFAAASPEQRAGEATPSYLMSDTAARASRSCNRSAHHRDPARARELSALAASAESADHAETETNLRKALALEEDRRQGNAIPRDADRRRISFIQSTSAMSSSCAAITRYFHPSRCWCSSTRISGATTKPPFVRCCGSWRSTNPSLGGDKRKPDGSRAIPRAYGFLRSLHLGRGPAARVAKAGIKAFTPRQLRREATASLERRVLYRDPGPPDERLMLELRRRFKGEVTRERVPGSGPH